MSKSILRKAYDGMNMLPASARNRAMQALFCNAVKYAGTSGVQFLELSPQRAVMRIRNRRKAQNHIGGLHAVAMALVGESATGVLVGLNLPGNKIPVIKHMAIDYNKRCSGHLTATATLSDEQIQAMRTQDKGEARIAVSFTDQDGKAPIEAEMIWAWVSPRS